MTWEARKDGRYYYCFVSGGHVVLGSRLDSAILVDESKTASVEDFLKPTSTFPDYVKEKMGEKAGAEVRDKAEAYMRKKNQKTSSPQNG